MDLSPKSKELLLEIANCKNSKKDYVNCQKIFEYQKQNHISDLLPVPWQGHIEQAKILFLSSNPSELQHGVLAKEDWLQDEGKIIDFFENRFTQKWSKCGTYYLTDAGILVYQRYWGQVKNTWAKNISCYLHLGEVLPGDTYALTEIVHCYSQCEIGVDDALKVCPSYYLGRILKAAKETDIVVVFGEYATTLINEFFETTSSFGVHEKLDFHPLEYRRRNGAIVKKTLPGLVIVNSGLRKIKFIALPYPNRSPYPKDLVEYLSKDEMNRFLAD